MFKATMCCLSLLFSLQFCHINKVYLLTKRKLMITFMIHQFKDECFIEIAETIPLLLMPYLREDFWLLANYSCCHLDIYSACLVYLLSQKSHGKGRSSQWRNLMWIFRAATVVQVMSQRGHFTWFTESKWRSIINNWPIDGQLGSSVIHHAPF